MYKYIMLFLFVNIIKITLKIKSLFRYKTYYINIIYIVLYNIILF